MLTRSAWIFAIMLLLAATGTSAQSDESKTVVEADNEPRLLVVYDSSNSMWGELADGSRKYEAGRSALSTFLASELEGRLVGFRAYGHRDKTDCRDSELIVPFSNPDIAKAEIKSAVDGIRPTGKTPITHSLREALNDFDGKSGDILLIRHN